MCGITDSSTDLHLLGKENKHKFHLLRLSVQDVLLCVVFSLNIPFGVSP